MQPNLCMSLSSMSSLLQAAYECLISMIAFRFSVAASEARSLKRKHLSSNSVDYSAAPFDCTIAAKIAVLYACLLPGQGGKAA